MCHFFKLLFLTLLLSSVCLWSQNKQTVSDSTKVLNKIENFANQRRFTKWLHKLVFVSHQNEQNTENDAVPNFSWKKYEGKYIRKIHIYTLDPFGFSDTDSCAVPKHWSAKLGNNLHIRTKDGIIDNFLLIKKGMCLDSLLILESERLIRSQHFVRSITILPIFIDSKKDTVDLHCRVLDSWSLFGNITGNTSSGTISVTERNFLGLGHEFRNDFIKSLQNNRAGYGGSYFIPNINHSFIQLRANYQSDLKGYYDKSFKVERPFFSTYSNWAAGMIFRQKYSDWITLQSDFWTKTQNYTLQETDVWASKAFRWFDGDSELSRNTKWILSGRYFHQNYLEKPIVEQADALYLSSQHLVMVGFDFSSQKFERDRFLFNYNITEDVATGVRFQSNMGVRLRASDQHFYLGNMIKYGDYLGSSYWNLEMGYGSFLGKGLKASETTLYFKGLYFSKLKQFRNWRYRFFLKPELILGYHRQESNLDRLTLIGLREDLNGTEAPLLGDKRWLMSFQFQGYSPWQWLGFRVNPFVSYNIGMLGQKGNFFGGNRLYNQINFGFLIKNDFLVFESFQFSFSYYPWYPGRDGGVFRSNDWRTYDIGLPRFEAEKPNVLKYE